MSRELKKRIVSGLIVWPFMVLLSCAGLYLVGCVAAFVFWRPINAPSLLLVRVSIVVGAYLAFSFATSKHALEV